MNVLERYLSDAYELARIHHKVAFIEIDFNEIHR